MNLQSIEHENLPHFKTSLQNFGGPVVEIGDERELSPDQMKQLRAIVEARKPWKKGPFRFFGIDIDAEWRSDLKWERLLPFVESLEGKRVADIGCHNGYFMFRMAALHPEVVVGMEPYRNHLETFQLFQRFAQREELRFELMGVEDIDRFESFFDTVFCLGILYHSTDPVGCLRKIRLSMSKGAALFVDCQGIPGEESVAFVPPQKYAGARGIWNLPTKRCLENWLRRSGFRDIECIFEAPLSTDEQRTTSWAPIRSLSDFLDPRDITKTIEGHPAPWRFYMKAYRG